MTKTSRGCPTFRLRMVQLMLLVNVVVVVQGFTFAPASSRFAYQPFAAAIDKGDAGDAQSDISTTSTSPAIGDAPQGPPMDAEFGQVVRRKPPSATASTSTESDMFAVLPSSSQTTTSSVSSSLATLAAIRRRNVGTAIAAIMLAALNYFWQFTHPYSPTQLLVQLQASSCDLSVIGTNGRPTLVDFWAPWCENCKLEAATLEQIHKDYAGRVNFVMINGDDTSPRSWEAIETFGVDVVPHMALVNDRGEVETALVGIVPKHVIEADLDSLLSEENGKGEGNQKLPYTMLDTFASRPEQRKLHFE